METVSSMNTVVWRQGKSNLIRLTLSITVHSTQKREASYIHIPHANNFVCLFQICFLVILREVL